MALLAWFKLRLVGTQLAAVTKPLSKHGVGPESHPAAINTVAIPFRISGLEYRGLSATRAT
jgi:hypothetical protein